MLGVCRDLRALCARLRAAERRRLFACLRRGLPPLRRFVQAHGRNGCLSGSATPRAMDQLLIRGAWCCLKGTGDTNLDLACAADCALAVVASFGELLDHLEVECRNVGR